MTRFGDLATVGPDDEVEAALKLIQTRGVDQLPVVAEGRRIVGLLTRGDFAPDRDASSPRRVSHGPMLSLEEAQRRLLARASITGDEQVELRAAGGRVLADPRIVAPLDVPPFANSAMDGFAMRASDTPGALRISGEVAAGRRDLPTVSVGEAVRITTGAPLPPGADTVVPIEE